MEGAKGRIPLPPPSNSLPQPLMNEEKRLASRSVLLRIASLLCGWEGSLG
jgi:hypothetical protein